VTWLCNASVWSKCVTCQDVLVNLVVEMEARNNSQWCAIFFCVKFGDNATTTHGKLQQAFGEDAVSRARAFRWHNMFSEGRTVVGDEQRNGRPSTRTGDNTARVRDLFDPIED